MDKDAFEKIRKDVEREIFPSDDEVEENQEKRIDWILNKAREAGYENLGALAATLYKNLGLAMPGPVGKGSVVRLTGKMKPDQKIVDKAKTFWNSITKKQDENKMKKAEDLLEGVQEEKVFKYVDK